MVLLFLGKHLLDDGQIFRVDIVDTSTIARTLVVSLLVETRRIDGFEKHLQQEFKTDHIRIESHKDGLGKACLVGVYLLISRIFRMPVGESHLRDGYTLNLLEVMLRSPKAASSKKDVFTALDFKNPVHLMFNKRTCFALQENTGFKALQSMPDVLRNVNTVCSALLTDDAGCLYLTIIFIGRHSDFAL